MNATSKRQYDGAYNQLKSGESAIYRKVSGGSRIDGEWVAGVEIDVAITCYEDTPTKNDLDKGLAIATDVKVLVSAKVLNGVDVLIGDHIVFASYVMEVKQIDVVKSLEGITVLYQLFCSRMG